VPQGAEFQVNSFTTVNVDQISAAVAADAAGNFVVVWKSEYPYGLSHRIRARRFDAGGTPQGPDFQVDNVTSGRPQDPAVAMDAAGIFVVVWPSTFDYGEFSEEGSGIQARRYDASGNPQGGQFQVNTYTTGVQDRPQVAASAAGDFIVVWESGGSAGSDTNGPSIQGQRYGRCRGAIRYRVPGEQPYGRRPAVSRHRGRHGVVAAWLSSSSAGSDTSGGSIQARRFLLPDTTTTSSTSSTSTTATSTTSTTTLPTVELLPGRVTTIKPGTLAKFVAKPATGDAFPLPTAASMAAGGSLRVFDTAATAGDQTFTLPAIAGSRSGRGLERLQVQGRGQHRRSVQGLCSCARGSSKECAGERASR
jgi:hypothetical protein